MADYTHDSADDAFHEIQLSGKQLVFLFMATTVVSVIIFLCGVLVGRSVRTENLGADPVLAATVEPTPAPESLQAEPRAIEPPTPAREAQLTYDDRLQSERPISEQVIPRKEDAPKRVELPAARTETPRSAESKPALDEPEAAEAVAARPAEPAVPPPAAQGARPGTWIVQVISLKDRGAANQIVQRLKNKGYPAFLAVTSGAPTQLYKVQVGRYRERSEALQVQARLTREEKFDALIVR